MSSFEKFIFSVIYEEMTKIFSVAYISHKLRINLSPLTINAEKKSFKMVTVKPSWNDIDQGCPTFLSRGSF